MATSDAQLTKAIRLLTGSSGKARALRHFNTLKSNTEKQRFLRIWREVHKGSLLKPDSTPQAPTSRTAAPRQVAETKKLLQREVKLLMAPKPDPALQDFYHRLRINTVILVLITSMVLGVGVVVINYYKGDTTTRALLAPISFVLDTFGDTTEEIFTPPACPNVVYTMELSPAGLLVLPDSGTLEYAGNNIVLRDWDKVWAPWITDPIRGQTRKELLAKGLADRMKPIPLGPLSLGVFYDYNKAYQMAIEQAIVSSRGCLTIPDPTESINAAWVDLATIPETVQDTDLGYEVKKIPAPQGIFVVPTPIPAQTSDVAPQPTSTPMFVLKLESEFSQGISALRVKCGTKYLEQTEMLACTALTSQHLQIAPGGINNLNDTMARVDQLPSQICTTNLGNLPWWEITQGMGKLWSVGVDTYQAFGDAHEMSFIKDTSNGYVCAMSQNVATVVKGVNWVTSPEDPYFPGYGSTNGHGNISLMQPNGLAITLEKVFMWPIK